jgi:hypothetical protein
MELFVFTYGLIFALNLLLSFMPSRTLKAVEFNTGFFTVPFSKTKRDVSMIAEVHLTDSPSLVEAFHRHIGSDFEAFNAELSSVYGCLSGVAIRDCFIIVPNTTTGRLMVGLPIRYENKIVLIHFAQAMIKYRLLLWGNNGREEGTFGLEIKNSTLSLHKHTGHFGGDVPEDESIDVGFAVLDREDLDLFDCFSRKYRENIIEYLQGKTVGLSDIERGLKGELESTALDDFLFLRGFYKRVGNFYDFF